MTLKHEPSLDGLRAISAFAVLGAHAGVPGLQGGGRGVDVFFVLSGYLITGILLRQETVDLRDFWARRLRRLVPALLLVALAVFAVFPLRRPEVALALTYTMNLAVAAGWPFGPLTHTWSLAQEMQFYLLWPLALPYVRRMREPAAFVLMAWLAITLARAAIAPSAARLANFSPLTHATGMALGAALAMGARLPARWGLAGFGLISLSLALPAGYWMTELGEVAAEIGSALLINDLISRPSRLRSALSFRPLVFLGVISYGIYLWHIPLLSLTSPEQGWVSRVFMSATGAIALATLSFVTVESWAIRRRAQPALEPR